MLSSSLHLTPELTAQTGEFRKYFEKYGKVLSAEVMFNRETHKSRGFGFIVFEQEGGVDRVCTENEHSIDGKVVSGSAPLQYYCVDWKNNFSVVIFCESLIQ